jgi:hypothetical protein
MRFVPLRLLHVVALAAVGCVLAAGTGVTARWMKPRRHHHRRHALQAPAQEAPPREAPAAPPPKARAAAFGPKEQAAAVAAYLAQRPEVKVEDYTRDIKPILQRHCYSCHGPARSNGDLRLDTAASIKKGGVSGRIVVPGNSARSPLIAAVTGADGEPPRMPVRGAPLTAAEVEHLRSWIDDGAAGPDDEEPAVVKTDHWAFRPPRRPSPDGPGGAAARNAVDAFLAAGHAAKGLTPSLPASKGQLLRRVYIDLIGLPPTRAELQAFLADPAVDAYERVVDSLLASPRYGERWGRHWMDVWRYADPSGRKMQHELWWSHPLVWRWRDWIIRSLNADKGYDRMVAEMLAGDELAPQDPDALAGTGFLVCNRFRRERNTWLNGTIEHTGKAFLGLTIACARCHNHKFDPVSQRDYYNFRAFFEPHDVRVDPVAGEPSGPGIAHAFDANLDAPTYLFIRGNDKNPDKDVTIAPGVPAALGGPPVTVRRVALPQRPGNANQPKFSTGRRLALARWVTDPTNPLTARVAVNHVWARHFDRPLVDNVFDFGRRTKAPLQQPLLDWLAVELVEHGWSMKWLHRTLVTSAAYRMSTAAPGGAELVADPDNLCFARRSPRRVEAEVVRDALLHLAGNLDSKMGGPPLDCNDEPGSLRRSLYHRSSREERMPFLVTFDAANVEECYRRQESVVPQQALALANSALVWGQARLIARRLREGKHAPDGAFVTAAFEHVLGRSPAEQEQRACARFLARQKALLSDPSRLHPFPKGPPPRVAPAADPAEAAREHLIHALLNHNDFITVR